MFALLGFGSTILTWAAGATTVLVAIKHGWDVWQVIEDRKKRAPTADNPGEA